MFELYASWSKYLPYSKTALKTIKENFVGIELCNGLKQAELIKNSNLKVSIHNPLRKHRVDLSDYSFKEKFLKNNAAKICEASNTKTIGFHTGYSSRYKALPPREALSNTINSINFVSERISKKVIFESTVYDSFAIQNGCHYCALEVTSPIFFKKILSATRAGFLLDVSHNLVSYSTKAKNKEYFGSAEDYFDELLSVVSKKTFQLHVNVPSGSISSGLFDSHNTFSEKLPATSQVLALSKKIIEVCPNLEVITLEMSTHSKPIQHAKILSKQALIFKKAVKI